MAIVQISKIQHRRGLKENLPNLGSAELGWALDTRQLYIGNGALTEGAPTAGRTEILTEYSDILGLFASYTYSGEAATGRAVQTGDTALNPIARSLQDRLDEIVSVKSFGATGDGNTDDTEAINRALFQLYCTDVITTARKTLFFPAGVYKISDVIEIPTYAYIVGEGKDCVFIKQTNTGGSLVFSLADSLQQVGANIGNNSAIRPSYINISSLTFENAVDHSVGLISDAFNCNFTDVKFKGPRVDPSDPGNSTRGIFIESTPVLQTENIRFIGCDFFGTTYAVVADDDVHNITWDGCDFRQLYRGFNFGENTTGTGSSVDGPESMRIINSHFNDIADTAIYGYDGITGIISAFNKFKEVGNSYAGPGNPSAPVIVFNGDGNRSIGDIFERDDADDLLYPRVSHSNYSVYVQYPDETRFGKLHQKNGGTITINDNVVTPTATGIEINVVRTPMLILDYSLVRNGFSRSGRMLIAHSNVAQNLDDTFIENGAVGVTFSLANDGSSDITSIQYTATSIGFSGTFTYAIRYLK